MNQLSRGVLFMSGQLGVMLLARYFFQWILDFASQLSEGGTGASVALFSASAVGLALLAFRAFDGVTDPIAGALSDGWVAKGKERRALLWYAAPLPALGLALCFTPTFAMSEGLRWALLLVGMFVFFVGYTLYAIPYWSLTGDYGRGDEVEVSRLSNLLGVGLLIATALGFIATPALIDALGFMWAGVTVSLISLPLMVAPYFAAPPKLTQEETPQGAPSQEGAVGWEALKGALSNARFRATLTLFAGSQMSLTVMTSAAPFIAVDLLGGSKGDVGMLLGPLLGVALPASALTPWAARRFGWERSVAWACGLLALVYLGVGALGVNLIHSPMTTAMLIFGLGGPMVAALLGLEAEAISACADEAAQSARTEGEEAQPSAQLGVYFGVYNLVVKGCNGVAIAITGLLAERARSGELWAVRAMGVSAGLMLLLGLALYALMRVKPSVASREA